MKTPFSFGFGSSRLYSPKAAPSTPITTSAFSQPDVLRRKMEEKKLTHAETVTATISPVRLESHPGKMVMYFCPMKTINVIKKLAAGDGGSLPVDVTVEGLDSSRQIRARNVHVKKCNPYIQWNHAGNSYRKNCV